MIEYYLNWYKEASDSLNYISSNPKDFSKVNEILLVGMGGSGIVCDAINNISLEKNYKNCFVFKDFFIPKKFLNRNCLVFAVSYSGNTLETINSIKSFIKARNVAIVSSNGELLEIAKKNKLSFIKIKEGLLPRVALPNMLIASLVLLNSLNLTLIEKQKIRKSIKILKETKKKVELSKKVVQKIEKPIVLISSFSYYPLLLRFKNEINENSKMHCRIEIMPENFHNDIVGWERESGGTAIFLISKDNEKTYKFYSDFLKGKCKVIKIDIEGKSFLEKFLYGSQLFGIISVFLSHKNNVEPAVTKSINLYKEYLKKNY